jgi:hypothetical protein
MFNYASKFEVAYEFLLVLQFVCIHVSYHCYVFALFLSVNKLHMKVVCHNDVDH